jgi:glyoxylase-like metal-dependent hydrolase (beta-lactamase superfamily II)/ferredoxin
MANIKNAHPLNVEGSLFTDTTCIDCGTCFHLGPEIFHEQLDKSVVVKQPHGPKEWQLAKRAILSCPTNSIGVKGAPEDYKFLGTGLPFEIDQEVYYLGYTSRDSFGASAYLIKRPEGNILVDSPRFHPWLVKEIEAMGGVKFMFLTHQDDVADHQQFHDHFQAQRIIHAKDLSEDTAECEIILQGEESIQFEADLKIIMTPGHSKGHMNLLYKNMFLFTGDHIFVDQDLNTLTSSRGVCWYSWPEQIRSTEKLLSEKFQWVLPGHGGWGYFGVEGAIQNLKSLINVMKGSP